MVCIIQTNANNSKVGNDSLMQVIKELQAGIVVSEPHFDRRGNSGWFYSREKRSTVGIC